MKTTHLAIICEVTGMLNKALIFDYFVYLVSLTI